MSRKDNVKVHLRSHHNVQDEAQVPTQEPDFVVAKREEMDEEK